MPFTKLSFQSNFAFEDIEMCLIRKPMLRLANRFKVYKVKLIFPRNEGKTHQLWLIIGNLIENEKAYIYFRVNSSYNSIESFKILNYNFDSELLKYLKISLFIKLSKTNIYYFPSKIFDGN